MKQGFSNGFICAGFALVLAGCGSSNQYEDLTQYMDEIRARPHGKIEPLPDFTPYEAFTYSASGERSPFDEPITSQRRDLSFNAAVRPDPNRTKQFLEGFALVLSVWWARLTMMAATHALVNIDGSVYRVKVGDYMGRNHGRMTISPIVRFMSLRLFVMVLITGWRGRGP